MKRGKKTLGNTLNKPEDTLKPFYYLIMNRRTILIIIFCAFSMKEAYSQDRTITGKVIDFKGRPVAGVNVVVKDYSSLMTITGVDGQFRIAVYSFTKALQFDFAGMKAKEVNLTESNQLLVVMDYKAGKNPSPWNLTFYGQVYKSNVITPIKNNDTSWSCSGAPGSSLSVEIEYFLTQNLGFSTGIGINSYKGKASLNNFNNYGSNTVSKTDIDNENYYLYNTVNNLEEQTKVQTISFPIKIKYRFRPGKKWDYFIDAGCKVMYTTKTKIKAVGQCSWQGYYPQYHVVLYDLPEYGFNSYQINSENKIPDYSRFMISIIADAGISYSIGKKANFDLGVFYEHGLSDLSYKSSVYEADYLNTIGVIDKTFIRGLGIILGFRYNFVRKK